MGVGRKSTGDGRDWSWAGGHPCLLMGTKERVGATAGHLVGLGAADDGLGSFRFLCKVEDSLELRGSRCPELGV